MVYIVLRSNAMAVLYLPTSSCPQPASAEKQHMHGLDASAGMGRVKDLSTTLSPARCWAHDDFMKGFLRGSQDDS